MGMFGDLADFPLAELLPTLAERTGILTVVRTSGSAQLHITDHQIVHLAAPQVPHPGTWAAQEYMVGLLTGPQVGQFTFHTVPAAQLQHTSSWPIQWLLLEVLGTSGAGAQDLRSLPDPETVFVVAPDLPTTALPPELHRRWQTLAPWLDGQRSLHEIAGVLHSPDLVYTVARLQVLGYVRPVRRFTTRLVPGPGAGVHKSLLRQIAGLLRLGAA